LVQSNSREKKLRFDIVALGKQVQASTIRKAEQKKRILMSGTLTRKEINKQVLVSREPLTKANRKSVPK